MKNLKDKIFEESGTERFKLWNKLEQLVDEKYEKPMDFLEDFFEYIPTNIIRNALDKLEKYNS